MQARIEQWGQSLALRIPSSLATQVQLEPNTVVEVELHEGKLVVSPTTRPRVTRVTLEQLLAGVTDDNRHDEFQTGPAVGGEAW